MAPDDLRKMFPNASSSTIARNADPARRVVSNPQREQDPVYEFVATDAGKVARQGRLGIVVTSFRCKLLDDDNVALGSKPLVDGLVEAGFIPSDSKIWCTISHRQIKVDCPGRERTEIELFPLEPADRGKR